MRFLYILFILSLYTGVCFGALLEGIPQSTTTSSSSSSTGGTFQGIPLFKYRTKEKFESYQVARPKVQNCTIRFSASGGYVDLSKYISDRYGRRLALYPGLWRGKYYQYDNVDYWRQPDIKTDVKGLSFFANTVTNYVDLWYRVDAFYTKDGAEHVVRYPGRAKVTLVKNKVPIIEGDDVILTIKDNETITYQFKGKDQDNDKLTFSVVVAGRQEFEYEQLSMTKDGILTFKPKPYYLGTIVLYARANDGYDTGVKRIEVTITEGHKKPVAKNINATARENISTGVNLSASDENGDPLTYKITKNPEHGSVTISGKSIRFYPGTNRLDPVTINYVAMDPYSESEPATVSIDIIDLPNAPMVSVPNSTTYNVSQQYNLSQYFKVTKEGWAGGVTLSMEVDGQSLFKDDKHPTISSDGSISFFPDEEKLGLATLTVTVKNTGDISKGGSNTTKKTFYLNIDTTNKPPVFGADLSNVTTRNIGFQEITGFVDMSKLAPGPDYESSQTTHFTYSVTNDELFLDPETGVKHTPQIDSNGNLKFYIPAYVKGTASVIVNLHDDKGAVTAKKFYIYINTLSQAPTFLIKEDTYQLNKYEILNVEDFAYDISGINEELGQFESSLITVISGEQFLDNGSSPSFIRNANGNYDLAIMPKRYVKGSVEIEVAISNNADILNGGENTTSRKVFFNINTVNRSPVISLSKSVIYKLDGDRDYPETEIVSLTSKGKSDEADQSISFHLDVLNPSFFSVAPVLTQEGILSFTIADDVEYEDATLKITAYDDGPTINGGSNISQMKQLVVKYRTLPSAQVDIVNLDNDEVCYTNNVLKNDVKTPGVEFIVKDFTDGAFGSVTYLSEGVFKYELNTNTTLPDQFSYTLAAVNDPGVVFSVSKVIVTRNPVALESTVELIEDELSSINILPNVSDPDGHDFHLESILIEPSHGIAKVVNGNVQYKPGRDFFGQDFLTYEVMDSSGAKGSGVLNINVQNVNDAPVAPEIVINLDPNAVASSIEINTLEGAIDPDGDELHLESYSATQQLYQEYSGNGIFNLLDISGGNLENGFDCFEFTLSDGNTTTTSKAFFKLTDIGDIELPNLEASTYKTIYSAGNIAIDEFIGSGNAYRLISQGSMDLGNVNFDEDDRVLFSVFQHNSKPDIAYGFELYENNELDLSFLFNELQVESGSKIIHFDGFPSDGTFAGYEGNVSYVPFEDFYGYDQFNMTLNNNIDESLRVKVGLDISGNNDAPTFDLSDIPVTNEDEFDVIDVPGFLRNVYSGEYFQGLTGNITNFSDETFFEVLPHITAGNMLTYKVALNRNGQATFDVVITDDDPENPLSTTKTAIIYVNPVNDAPLISQILIYNLLENESLSVDQLNGLLSTAYDVEGDPISIIIDASGKPTQGEFSYFVNGAFDYNPNQYYFGTDSIGYRVSDGDKVSDLYNAFLVVEPVNTAPFSQDFAYQLNEDGVLTKSASQGLLSYAIDIENDQIFIKSITQTENATLSYNADGSFTYTPKENYHGSDIHWLVLKDQEDDSEPVCVKFNVLSVNDSPEASEVTYQFSSSGNLVYTSGNGLVSTVVDADGDDLTFALREDALSGNIHLEEDGSFVYLPAGTWSETNFFTYNVSDGFETVEGRVNLQLIDSPEPSVNIEFVEHWDESYVNLQAVISDMGESGHEGEVEYLWEILPNPYGLEVSLSNYDEKEVVANFNLWASYDYQFKVTASYRGVVVEEVVTIPYRSGGEEFRVISAAGQKFYLNNVASGSISDVTVVDTTSGLFAGVDNGSHYIQSNLIGNDINQIIITYSDGSTEVLSFYIDTISLEFPAPFMKDIDTPFSVIEDTWKLNGLLGSEEVSLISITPSYNIGVTKYIKSSNDFDFFDFVIQIRDQFGETHQLEFSEYLYFDDAVFENPVWEGPAVTFQTLPDIRFKQDLILELNGERTDMELIVSGDDLVADPITLRRTLKPVGEQYSHIPSVIQTFTTTPVALSYFYDALDISKYVIDHEIKVQMAFSPSLPDGQIHNVNLDPTIRNDLIDNVIINIESKDKCYAIKENTYLVSQTLPDGTVNNFYRFIDDRVDDFFDISFDSTSYSRGNFNIAHSLSTNNPSDALIRISVLKKDYNHESATYLHQCDLPELPGLVLSFPLGAVIKVGESRYRVPESVNLSLTLEHFDGVIRPLHWMIESHGDYTGDVFQNTFSPGEHAGSVEFTHNGQLVSHNFTLEVFPDTDNDQIDDVWEVANAGGLFKAGYDDKVEDQDQDNLGKYAEFIFGTNIQNKDSDNDSFHPTDKSILNTTDGYEYLGASASRFTIPSSITYDVSNPNLYDTDKDGMNDGWETYYNLDPKDSGDAWEDADGDGLKNIEEYVYKANPHSSDTDGDGYTDQQEANSGSDPGDDSDGGQAPPNSYLFGFWLGDPSGSHSENYYLSVFNEAGEELFGMFGPSYNPVERRKALAAGNYQTEINFLGGSNDYPNEGDHIFHAMVPLENEEMVTGDYVVNEVIGSNMTVHKSAASFVTSNTGQPWPLPVLVDFTVVEEIKSSFLSFTKVNDSRFVENEMTNFEEDKFLLVRDLNSSIPFEINFNTTNNTSGYKSLYKIVGATNSSGEILSNQKIELEISFSDFESSVLSIGLDINGNEILDSSEVTDTLDVRPLYWKPVESEKNTSFEKLNTVPFQYIETLDEGMEISFIENCLYSIMVYGYVENLSFAVRHENNLGHYHDEIFGNQEYEGTNVSSLIQNDGVVMSENKNVIFSSINNDGSIDESHDISALEWGIYSNVYGINILKDGDNDVSLNSFKASFKSTNTIWNFTIKFFKKHQNLLLEKDITIERFGGAALRFANKNILEKLGNDLENTAVLTLEELDPLYYLLIVGAKEAELHNASRGMHLWVQGTARDGFSETKSLSTKPFFYPDSFPGDYLELSHTLFDLETYPGIKFFTGIDADESEELYNSTLIGKLRTQLRNQVDSSKVNVIETYETVSTFFPLKDAWGDDITENVDMKAAVGGMSIWGLGRTNLPNNVEGGKWMRTGPAIDGIQPIKIYLKIQVFDIYDPLEAADFPVPIPDGGPEINLPDSWMSRYQELPNNWTGGQATPYHVGTGFNWPVVEVNTTIGE